MRARQYVEGLLTADGRKTIRNIASATAGDGGQQSLHHFLNSSAWDWHRVLDALAEFLESSRLPQAWVVSPLSIPKTGRHSVGVSRHYAPETGHLVYGQRAFGAWYVTEDMTAPVNWRLHLPQAWLDDGDRPPSMEIPEQARSTSLEQCALDAVDDVRRRRGGREPVVLDGRGFTDPAWLRSAFGLDVPLLIRVDSTLPLPCTARGRNSRFATAQQLLTSEDATRRIVRRAAPAPSGSARMAVTATARAVLTAPGGRARGGEHPYGDLLLLGEWGNPRLPPTGVWLTNMTRAPEHLLLRMTRLAHRVARDTRARGNDIGLCDFEGRSFRGWHRHMALASAAYAVLAWNGLGRGGPDYESELSA
ncbi:transposase [Streptomyces sp. SID7909]|nr:transposase [Streptomyces sp. SID7909]